MVEGRRMSRPSTWGMLSEEMAEDAKEFFTEKSSGLHLPKVPKKKVSSNYFDMLLRCCKVLA